MYSHLKQHKKLLKQYIFKTVNKIISTNTFIYFIKPFMVILICKNSRTKKLIFINKCIYLWTLLGASSFVKQYSFFLLGLGYSVFN